MMFNIGLMYWCLCVMRHIALKNGLEISHTFISRKAVILQP